MTSVYSSNQRIKKEISLQQIQEKAKRSWLHVREIIQLLDEENSPLDISLSLPLTPPLSGTLLLYDRNSLSTYKQDGHKYVKKKNSNKVREDHLKLKLYGKPVVKCNYSHSATESSFHRRSYVLLDREDGKVLSKYQGTKPSFKDGEAKHRSIVLVHYLDTETALKEYRKQDRKQASLKSNSTPDISEQKKHFKKRKIQSLTAVQASRKSSMAPQCTEVVLSMKQDKLPVFEPYEVTFLTSINFSD